MSDFDRLAKAIRGQWGDCQITCRLPVLRLIADTIREMDGLITITIIYDSARCYVINIQAGDTTAKNYGIAVDVGTTTVAVELV